MISIKVWLQFFRIVNLPTVPGDVLVGAAAVACGMLRCADRSTAVSLDALPIAAACVAAMALYLFGLADNDIVGAKTDGSERPIPSGALSLRAAERARAICLLFAAGVGCAAHLSAIWWGSALLLAAAIVVYNRKKGFLLMGLCRGLNVACGGAVLMIKSGRGVPGEGRWALFGLAALWTLYIAFVTKYSEGEEADPEKRRRVGFLVGALVYLQLGALLYAYFVAPCLLTRNLILTGAVLLVVLRLAKRLFPKVNAS